tara:strand:- start:7679 stop:7882 length:204 start_codon:yes stop_codon:yes gene_type:complete
MSMFNPFMEDGIRIWQVQFNSKLARGYVNNHTMNVSGKTIEEVIGKIKDKYPDCKILNINHKGSIDL